MYALLLLLAVQLGSDSLPSPSGYVNDFAGVLDPAAVSRMDAVIAEVRAKSRGEIAVVTLPGIGDRAASGPRAPRVTRRRTWASSCCSSP